MLEDIIYKGKHLGSPSGRIGPIYRRQKNKSVPARPKLS